jgi:hypothetical protein
MERHPYPCKRSREVGLSMIEDADASTGYKTVDLENSCSSSSKSYAYTHQSGGRMINIPRLLESLAA